MMKRKGMSIMEIALYAVFVVILAAGLAFGRSGSMTTSIVDNQLKDQAVMIDTSLSIWYQSHNQTYPVTLSVLATLQILPPGIDITTFTYSVQSANTLYRLEVALSNGVYVSPGSKF